MESQTSRRQPSRASRLMSWTQGPERMNAEIQAQTVLSADHTPANEIPLLRSRQSMPGALPDETIEEVTAHHVTVEEVPDEEEPTITLVQQTPSPAVNTPVIPQEGLPPLASYHPLTGGMLPRVPIHQVQPTITLNQPQAQYQGIIDYSRPLNTGNYLPIQRRPTPGPLPEHLRIPARPVPVPRARTLLGNNARNVSANDDSLGDEREPHEVVNRDEGIQIMRQIIADQMRVSMREALETIATIQQNTTTILTRQAEQGTEIDTARENARIATQNTYNFHQTLTNLGTSIDRIQRGQDALATAIREVGREQTETTNQGMNVNRRFGEITDQLDAITAMVQGLDAHVSEHEERIPEFPSQAENLRSWAQFKQAFNKAFGDPLKKEHAIQKVKNLIQKGSANNYTIEYCNLVQDLGWEDQQVLIDTYKQGLKSSVQKHLLMMTIGRDTSRMSLEEWMNLAIKTDDIEYASRTLNNQSSNTRNQQTEQGKAAYTPNDSTKRDDWISADIINKRKQDNRCIKCGRAGHRIAQCKSKKYMPDPIQGKASATIEEVEEDDKDNASTSLEN